ncbi:fanconi-associated nuclease 1 isoform X2 [Calliopsis andreniformis]|uniref:fanconi-associated nuclease 1 isoform X2 n=1 Tax=Calliopsis andreniformis TaxID=337506 RepID=UPI003FCC8CFF
MKCKTLNMAQQKRIDDYFLSKPSSRRKSNIIAKKCSDTKNTPYSKNRKKNNDKRQDTSLSQSNIQSTAQLDCIALYEEINNTNDMDIKQIKVFFQDDEELPSNNLSFHKNEDSIEPSEEINDIDHPLSPIIDTSRPLMAPKKLKSTSIANGKISDNNVQLKETNIVERELNENSSSRSRDSTPTSKKSNYSPKVPSTKSPRNITPKKLFSNHADHNDMVVQTIENMNLAKQGAIQQNKFDLEAVYSENTFDYTYSDINTKTSVKYELTEVTYPRDFKSKTLIFIISNVLSNPVNCGYFDEKELDFIYSILTLPEQAQMLLSRMISRKRTWHRKSNIKYENEMNFDLKNTFQILDSRSICTFNIENENLSSILELLQVEELRRLCRNMKIVFSGKKEDSIRELIKFSKRKPLYLGIKSPGTILNEHILNLLDYCVRITETTWDIIDKILTLLIPNEDPKKSTGDTFFTLSEIYQQKRVFPKINSHCFPIFPNVLHLLLYVNAKSTLSSILQFIEKKNWEKVREFGNVALDTLRTILSTESSRLKTSVLPMHVRRFMPGYIWLKILSISVDAFKKNKDKKQVIEILWFLINQDCHMQTRKGAWYNELALIEMFHHKNVESSAGIIMQALNENLIQVDKIELIERGNKILKKKTGVQPITKVQLEQVLDNHINLIPKYEPATNIIDASLMPNFRNGGGNKTVWCIKSNTDSQYYGSVENLALHHYCEREFSDGLHCEGALPILLFSVLFWEQIYEIHVPGTFITPYQEAPEDLFTEYFYENRRKQIDEERQKITQLDLESFCTMMEIRYNKYSQYQSIMPLNLLKNSKQLKEICYCLGIQSIIGICERLISNFKLWRAGFPDLIVWNIDTKHHKIVEVKGPKDTLSTKQRLWLEYLNKLGLSTEVCLVQDKNNAKRLREGIEESYN